MCKRYSNTMTQDAMRRLFAGNAANDALAKSIDLAAETEGRAFEIARVADSWMLRTWPSFARAIGAAANVGDQVFDLNAIDSAVLAAIAYHQPLTRDGLKDIFGKDISRELIGRLHARGLLATGPRSLRCGAPSTYVTMEAFWAVFELESLQELPDRERVEDAGIDCAQSDSVVSRQ